MYENSKPQIKLTRLNFKNSNATNFTLNDKISLGLEKLKCNTRTVRSVKMFEIEAQVFLC